MQEIRNLNCSSVEAGGILALLAAILKPFSTAKRGEKGRGKVEKFSDEMVCMSSG